MQDVAIVYNCDVRDNGTPFYFRYALERVLGQRPKWYQPHGEIPKHDFYIYIDDGRDDLKWLPPHPWGYYATDTHLGWDYRRWKAGEADIVWCAQKPAAERMRAEGLNAHWVPLACSPDHHRGSADPGPVQYDLVFVGHLQPPAVSNRVEFLDALFRISPTCWFQFGLFHNDMADLYRRGRIGVNHAVRDDLNMRFFELACAGVPQLCDRRMVGIADLGLVEDVHFIGYGSTEEAIEKARYYLANPSHCAFMARNALAWSDEHTYEHRLRTMLAGVN